MDLSHFYLPIATKSIRQVFNIDFQLADESEQCKMSIENQKKIFSTNRFPISGLRPSLRYLTLPIKQSLLRNKFIRVKACILMNLWCSEWCCNWCSKISMHKIMKLSSLR